MRKSILIVSSLLFLGACTGMQNELSRVRSSFKQSIAEKKEEVNTCLKSEAENKIQDGSAFAAPIRVTVKKMAETCLALETEQNPDTKLTQEELQQEAQKILMAMIADAEQKAQESP